MAVELKQIRGHSFFDRFREAPIVVDLGANVGKFAAEFLTLYPAARLLLVEGDPYLIDVITKTFGRCSNVQLFKGLIGAQSSARVPFHLCRVPEGNSVFGHFSESWSPGESREIQVEMTSLPDLLTLARIDHVDLLKVDIEGSEWDLLDALTEAEARRIDQISVEFHDFMEPAMRSRTERCIARLGEFGFELKSRGTDRVAGSPYFDCLFYRAAE